MNRAVGESLDLMAVETPVAVVDLARVRANAHRVVQYARGHGLRWRPHVKTHKSLGIARIQLEAGATGLTVATLHEAEVMSAVSRDLLLAYPPVGRRKLDRLVRLPDEVRLSVALDSPEVLYPLAGAVREAGRSVRVLVELDVGLGRVGVPDPQDAARLAAEVTELDGVEFEGLLFYAGHIRSPGPEQDRDMATLGQTLERVYAALDRRGLRPRVVSGGTTPTLWRSHEVPGLTEIRPGTCIYNDRDAVAQGAATPDDWAYSVLTTVVSTRVPGRAAVDAGSKALAKEARGGSGFGVVLGRPEVTVAALSEEHGVLDLSGTDWRPRVGDRIRIVPNHVCVSVNLQERILVTEGTQIEAWPLEGRGRLHIAVDPTTRDGAG
jgi:D-serine deaminase-like pyridoxal phosphate-dependent protein